MSPRGKVQNDQMRTEAMEKITKGALKVFAEYGYYGATMKKITEATELSYGLVYHYFASKEEVFNFLVNQALEKTEEVFQRALNKEGTSAWEKLSFLSSTLLEESLAGDSALFFHIMLQALTQCKSLPGLVESIDQKSSQLYERIIPVIMQAQEDGEAAMMDPVVMVKAYLSMVHGLALISFQDGGISKPITADILLNVLKR